VAVASVRLINKRLVDVNFLPPRASPPVEPAIVRPEVQLQPKLVG